MVDVTLEHLWRECNFTPNPKQEEAIKYVNGPLFLTAGPGSGKTRVLLWRTLNLIVFHEVDPQEIFLSTFTEKAARQLKDGLRTLLGFASNYTNKPYDIARMSIGTVHSICQQILTDRRFSVNGERARAPIVMDELAQYFKLYQRSYWKGLLSEAGYGNTDEDELEAHRTINQFFHGKPFGSRHAAVLECKSLFNRFSEENIDPLTIQTSDPVLKNLLKMYAAYLKSLSANEIKAVDLSLLQQAAYQTICLKGVTSNVYKHIIIDEYQDTNAIQEKIFFKLADGCKNICVVGDDDQALYRFRGATVENLVEFEKRCQQYISMAPKRIDLDINYRSRKQIVDIYSDFVTRTDWRKDPKSKEYYRVHDKIIKAFSQDTDTSVVISDHCKSPEVFKEIAGFVKQLKASGKLQDYNQCAFLFPSLKGNTRVEGFKAAFEEIGIEVYAPRAGNFFDVPEVKEMLGCILNIFDRPHYGPDVSKGINEFRSWMIRCMQEARNLALTDKALNEFINDKKAELAIINTDYEKMIAFSKAKSWQLKSPATEAMIRGLAGIHGLSQRAVKNLTGKYFLSFLAKRTKEGNPLPLEYVINRSTSLDWSVLDLFYQLCSFTHFRQMLDLAEAGTDEGFVCNLGMVSQYLGRFMEEKTPIITAAFLNQQKFHFTFFGSFIYALYRLGQSEYEDEEVPFPKGRIPFLTIHQSKGLEFPIVVLGSVYKKMWGTDLKEEIIQTKLTVNGKPFKTGGEPLDKMPTFDMMRMFYVGLSRAKNLLVLPCYKGPAHSCEPFSTMLHEGKLAKIKNYNIQNLPEAKLEKQELGKTYSYTGDFLNYQRCPRQYMIFRKYGFVTSRSQNQYFGSLVHQTIEDLHHLLKAQKQPA